MDPIFLTLEDVLEFHEDQILAYGGSAGVRDLGMLQSAIAMPQMAFGGQFAHSGPIEMAAAYLFHIAQNHPFIDGNKRVAAAACMTFLATNGIQCRMTNEDLISLTLATAEGKAGKDAIADSLRRHCGKPRKRRKDS